MSINAELAQQLQLMADVLELLGENRFRVAAFQRGARVIEDLADDVAQLAQDPDQLTSIEGIGKGLAADIREYLDTGKIEELEKRLANIPDGVLKLLEIPGVGPKTVATLWKQGGVTSIASLKQKLSTGELESLPRMGAKTLEKIGKSLEFTETSAGRVRIGDALAVAAYVVGQLSSLACVERAAYAGSLRRGKETIGDVDILVACDDAKKVVDTFTKLKPVTQVLAAGQTKSSVRFEGGIQVDLRIVRADRFGAALMYFTGSKEHNVALRERAIKQNLRLNEYGLWRAEEVDDDDEDHFDTEPVAAEREEEVYKTLGLAYIPPMLREHRGEITAAANGKLPTLVELDDIRSELHAHTTASDGRMSIEELAAVARERGFHTIAVTDHSVSQTIANGLTAQRLEKHIQAVHAANEKTKGIRILAGSEVDILADGKLDYPNSLLKQLDIVVASPHAALTQDAKKATARLIRAIENPYVHIIGHPTGRLINRRKGLDPDMKKLITAAADTHTALEINANHYRLDLRDVHARAAIEAGVKLAINTDAHRPNDFEMLRFGVLTAQRAWATKDDVINCLSAKALASWLAVKRKKMG